MRTFEVQTVFMEYDSPEELPDQDRELLAEAQRSMLRAYAPYSGFQVGAAVLLENGTIVSGNNQENASYPTGLCAERVAAFAASSQFPGMPIRAIAVSAHSDHFKVDKPVAPCGACRQALAEYEKPAAPIRVILSGESGKVLTTGSVAGLLPLLFHSGHLEAPSKKD